MTKAQLGVSVEGKFGAWKNNFLGFDHSFFLIHHSCSSVSCADFENYLNIEHPSWLSLKLKVVKFTSTFKNPSDVELEIENKYTKQVVYIEYLLDRPDCIRHLKVVTPRIFYGKNPSGDSRNKNAESKNKEIQSGAKVKLVIPGKLIKKYLPGGECFGFKTTLYFRRLIFSDGSGFEGYAEGVRWKVKK